ncbi:glutathione S-transferase family protein [Paraglaciecola arctica]|uniref:glutathione S-transferase family protein n=1 Tax=Paraglaciecola arctica TaxID=1128911 RepID=UPI001C076A8E|nr:glutathione S-transferase N-terminal domain-containing protein [Paraglaciecola arctica]MBU3002374.1 glutathione S-transferase N-terminal domain-containing protein [Paraglaciecola arctica]
MLTLIGFDVSNYFNMVKLALAIKGIEYKTDILYPNQTDEYLSKSPMGKVPALATEQGVLTETNVILEYLDEAYPDKPLYPGDAFEKAKIRELVKMAELYLELPARRCHLEAFFGQKVDELTKKEVKRALCKGIEGIARCAQFKPYLAGEQLTAADIVFLYSADLAAAVAGKLFAIDLFEMAPGAKQLMEKLNQREDVIKIAEDRKVANIAFQKYIASLS